MDGFIYDILIKSENYIIVLSKKKCPLIFKSLQRTNILQKYLKNQMYQDS